MPRIALIAHDGKKTDVVAFAMVNRVAKSCAVA